MGATGILFEGTAAEAREKMLSELHNVLRGQIINYSFVKDAGEIEIYMAVRFPEFNNVVVGEVANYTYYQKYGEIVYHTDWEISGAVRRNCPEKLLRQLSPIAEILKSGLIEDYQAEYAQEWRNDCWSKVAEKKKISLSALKKKEKTRGAFKIQFQTVEGEHDLTFSSVADFKTRGKILKLGNINLNCSCADYAKKALDGIKKAFVEGATGFNVCNLSAYHSETQINLF